MIIKTNKLVNKDYYFINIEVLKLPKAATRAESLVRLNKRPVEGALIQIFTFFTVFED